MIWSSPGKDAFRATLLLFAIAIFFLSSQEKAFATKEAADRRELSLTSRLPAERIEYLNKLVSDNRFSSYVVIALSKVLYCDADAAVRAEAAQTYGRLAIQNRQSEVLGMRTPQVVRVLSTAYAQEVNPFVRRTIVLAISEYDEPEIALFFSRALQDRDAEVRQAAQEGKKRRYLRLLAQGKN